jgi:hypothetical protein
MCLLPPSPERWSHLRNVDKRLPDCKKPTSHKTDIFRGTDLYKNPKRATVFSQQPLILNLVKIRPVVLDFKQTDGHTDVTFPAWVSFKYTVQKSWVTVHDFSITEIAIYLPWNNKMVRFTYEPAQQSYWHRWETDVQHMSRSSHVLIQSDSHHKFQNTQTRLHWKHSSLFRTLEHSLKRQTLSMPCTRYLVPKHLLFCSVSSFQWYRWKKRVLPSVNSHN